MRGANGSGGSHAALGFLSTREWDIGYRLSHVRNGDLSLVVVLYTMVLDGIYYLSTP